MNVTTKTLLAALALVFIQTATAAGQGDAGPDCQLQAFKGNGSLPLKTLRGQVVYVDFWASWCGPCAKSFPFLNGLNDELKNQGLRIVAVNMDENPQDAEAFLAKLPAAFTVATDVEAKCAQQFDVKAMPSSYLIDRKGIIRHIHLGFKTDEAEEVKSLVTQLLAEH